ncbi:formate dehydrogenase region TAT target [Thalassovita autumnalis]|uniref:Formate dehydrogenase region TAT target n=1 Tax=Thalassovita autumnalis TaxID=2072972 RepID=A0A0P1FRG5_9RHOB|nr:ubiquinol-cytochrome c reductase iron-sulfur subunit N-terminal domain-containing protein [Thalassovita autumnalis]CUH67862.1 formate dehydrogenase region TAT target [Thalassovita autumnalis]CUH70894.1 formate dehydrogenase region TAT target [Thalassovita autumnalis]
MSKSDASQTTRRDFLKVAATSVPAAAAAVAVSGDAAEAAPVDLTSERMQDTAHVRTYYDLARF